MKIKQIILLISLAILLMGCGTNLQISGSEPLHAEEVNQTVQRCVVIDPGHQSVANLEEEQLGPGSPETKAKVTGGTSGRVTGVPEYELSLQIAKKVESILLSRGYRVVMTRTTNDVNISNQQRAQIANSEVADAFVRIHANGSEDSQKKGAMTICMAPDSPYNSDLYNRSFLLSSEILDSLVSHTGCEREKIWETNSMTGINWSAVPVSIVEVGYMTNEEEEQLLVTEDYQEKIALGIADGIDAFFEKVSEQESNPLYELQCEVDDFLSDQQPVWDVYIEDLKSGDIVRSEHNLNHKASMVSASIIKLFIAGATLNQVESGEIEYAVIADDLASMITVSDNSAANRLVTLLGDGIPEAGMNEVNKFAQSIGCNNTELNRLMLVDNGLENYTTSSDCTLFLRKVYLGELINNQWSDLLLQLLKDQTINDRLPKYIPEGTNVAHKTGNLQNKCCADVGIVFLNDHPYVISIITNNSSDDAGVTEYIAELSKLVFDWFSAL